MELKIEYIKTNELKPYGNNARDHQRRSIESIKASIKEFGFNDPIGVWKGMIVEGHGRWQAATELGYEEVPIIRLDHLTDEQRRAYALAHNKTAEMSDWLDDVLSEELKNIGKIDMEQFGFDLDVDIQIPEIEKTYEDDEIPEANDGSGIKRGDVYLLGNHRLMCGDSTSKEDVSKLLGGAYPDLVFTDPPYGMKKESDGVANDNLNFDELLDFNKKWFSLAFDSLKDTGCIYVWGIDEPLMDFYSQILKPLKKANKLCIRNYITWAKHLAQGINSTEMLSYPRETEKCWFVMKGMDWNCNNAEFFKEKFSSILEYMQEQAKKANINNKVLQDVCGVQMFSHWFTKSQFCIISREHYEELHRKFPDAFCKPYDDLRKMLGTSSNPNAERKPYFDNVGTDSFGDIGLTDVWRIPTTSGKEKESVGGHATPKPLALCRRAIKASSRENEKVLDLFGGSGSTLIACEQLGRSCMMMEYEPKWVDVIIRRWENLSGKKAVKL